jgi:16S rRNA processing protein RimM
MAEPRSRATPAADVAGVRDPGPGTGSAGSRVCVARIGAAHGIAGEVRLFTFTADPMAVTHYGPLQSEDGEQTLAIATARPGKGFLVARFAGIADRSAAERLCHVELYVPRERLPAPDEPETYYHADLIGLVVDGTDGARLGTVAAVHDFGAGDLLEVAPAGGGQAFLLPFTRAVVPVVDLAARRLVADPPAGLLPAARDAGRAPRPPRAAES